MREGAYNTIRQLERERDAAIEESVIWECRCAAAENRRDELLEACKTACKKIDAMAYHRDPEKLFRFRADARQILRQAIESVQEGSKK